MLEKATGFYTGSVYGDKHLSRSGFLGEPTKYSKRWTFIVKNHMLLMNALGAYDSAIFLVRNPYKAHVAEYNRMKTYDQLGHAKTSDFFSQDFQNIVMGKWKIKSWVKLIRYVVKSKKKFHLVIYEELVQDPINEIRKVIKFLEKNNGFKQYNLEERLLCLSENIEGTHKRTKN